MAIEHSIERSIDRSIERSNERVFGFSTNSRKFSLCVEKLTLAFEFDSNCEPWGALQLESNSHASFWCRFRLMDRSAGETQSELV